MIIFMIIFRPKHTIYCHKPPLLCLLYLLSVPNLLFPSHFIISNHLPLPSRYNYGVGGAFTGVFAALFNAMNLDRAFAESTNNSIHTYKETVVDKSKYLTGSSWVKATSMAMARNFFVFGKSLH